ncbi:type II toxin-antitoxin system HipA family toxin [Hydrocarboniphaga sp.]|uniref:type II toxin-antitoxin system HipA family toxin n=1 Tax=Hydrocarboniphaga sp. TaxID=2033016 RepID=UPI0026262124|nr:type II toxin-antitoxin system HipA family toxin [Hydrocarboniphaga sp.]
MNGEHVGNWSVRPGKPDEFGYSREWLTSDAARPISLSMPLRPTPHRGDAVAAYFDNLLPDNHRVRERLQRRFGARSYGSFDLLSEIGRDCVGAIQILPDGAPVPDIKTLESEPITDQQIEDLLIAMLAAPIGRADENEDFRISLAGAQEKTALLKFGEQWRRPRGTTPSTHILKLPIGTGGGGNDLTTSVENEWLCAQILKTYGVPVAECWMDRFGEQKVLAVERFDRKRAADGSWIIRLPQEDFCQAVGVPSDRKYESDGGPGIQPIMSMLLGSSQAEQDRYDFLKTQMLFWMLCAIDGHAKNFSVFIEAGGSYRLTPRYDVLSAFPVLGTSKGNISPHKAKMAMAVEGKNRHYLWHSIQPRHWQETAKRCGMVAAYQSLRDELIQQTNPAIEKASKKIPSGFPGAVADSIIDGLKLSRDRLASQ